MKTKHLKAYMSYKASKKKPIDFEQQLLDHSEKLAGTPYRVILEEKNRIKSVLVEENAKNLRAQEISHFTLANVRIR